MSRVLMIPGWRRSYKLGSRVPVRIYRLVTSHNFAVSLPHSRIDLLITRAPALLNVPGCSLSLSVAALNIHR